MSNFIQQTVILPDLITTCPFDLDCNMEYEYVSKETEAWLHSFSIPYTESHDKYNLWSALTFPHSSRRRLREACDVWTLLFLADDVMDSLLATGSTDYNKRELFQNMNECLQPTGTFKPMTPFASALHDWWQRVCLSASKSIQQRLIQTYQQSNAASLFQVADLKNRQTIPDLETYIALRRDTSYGRVVCAFLEHSLDLQIPDECWRNEAFRLLIDFTTDAAAWTNDVYSYSLEHARGDYNLVTVIHNMKPSFSIQEALDEAGHMIIQRYHDFQRVRTELPSWGETIDQQVNQFVSALASGIIANAVWSFETPRYFGKDKELIKRTRCITLMVDEDIFSDALSDIEDDSQESLIEMGHDGFLPIGKAQSIDSDSRNSLTSEDDIDESESELGNIKYAESSMSEKSSRPTSNTSETQQMEEILSPFLYLNSLSGKKVRSKLIAAFNYWFRVPQDKLAIIDEVIGMLHNASLMIDDIEDGSLLRRGEPAAHMVYGVPLTINAAELACFLAMQKAMELDHPLVGRIMISNLIELHKGQGCDIWWRDNRICPSEEDYRQMVMRKCGGLFQLIIDLMRICSPIDHSEKQIQMINELCQCLSLLFQIRDDYCNLMSPEYTQSKSYCEDISEGKYSFVIIHALRTYPNDRRIENILRQRTENIELKRLAVNLMHQFGSINYTREKCVELAAQATNLVDRLRGNLFLKMLINQLMCTFDLPVEQQFSPVRP